MKKLFGATIIFVILLNGCGGGGGDDIIATTPVEPIATFQEVSEELNKLSPALTLSAKGFIETYNALSAFDPYLAEGDAIGAPLIDMVAALEIYQRDLENYVDLLEKYYSYTNTTDTLASSILRGVPPLSLVKGTANLLEGTKDAVDKLTPSEGNTDIGEQALIDAENRKVLFDVTLEYMGAAFDTGVGAILGAGAGGLATKAFIAGGATFGAPIIIKTAIVGGIVGGVYSFCKYLTKSIEGEEVCSVTSITTEAVELPNGDSGFAVSLPQGGPGTLCLHLEGNSPLCIDTTVGVDGNTINLDCWDDTFDPIQTKECNEKVTVDEGIAMTGTNCATDVFSLSVVPVVGSEFATVNVGTTLSTEGCTIEYSVIGTDGYTQAGALFTDTSGHVSFQVPAGERGVFDSVSMTATESGVSTTAGYTF